MKKKVLFVEEGLGIGGAEKSLLTILSLFDYEKYDVSLFLFNHDREQMEMIPSQVRLLPEDQDLKSYLDNRKKAPIVFLKKKDYKKAWASLKYLIGVGVSRLRGDTLYIGWKEKRIIYPEIREKYDVAISFLERTALYFTVDNVRANKYISFIHNDYSVYPYDKKEDERCLQKCSAIFTVSKHCKEVLEDTFPQYREKFRVMYNMVSPDLILHEANKPIKEFKFPIKEKKIVTVGRLVYQKGIDRAIEACSKLKKQGVLLQWFVIGEGEEREHLEDLIKKNKVSDCFHLLGLQINPYKWMNIADVYVQPSRYEGFGITIAEANTLNRPIVCSDISEFKEQLGDRRDCYFSDIDEMVQHIKKNLIAPNNLTNNTMKDNQKILRRLYKELE